MTQKNELLIQGKKFSDSHCLIIAEVGQNHDGSLGTAHAYIDAVAKAGADAIKFQTHIADAESTPDEPWRVKFSLQDASRYEYWQRMEFTEDQWHGLKKHATEKGLVFLSSPFSIEAVELLSRVGVGAWKIASGEVGNVPMFDAITDNGLPVFLSTGMSPLSEIDDAVARIESKNVPYVVLQCTSMYPVPPEKEGINVITEFQDRYGSLSGLSDHSGSIYPGLAASVLGASVLEVHVTFSYDAFGPDISSSITIDELKHLVEGIRYIETMRSNPVDKDLMAADMSEMRSLFTKSVTARVDLEEGTILEREHLTVKKPGTGIPAAQLSEVVGAQLRRPIRKDEVIGEQDIS